MKPSAILLAAARVCVATLAIAVPSAWGQTFTTIDPPGSQGTSPDSINPAGQIVGTYFDSNFVTHGFLRDTDGTIIPFDAQGASHGTFPAVITPQGLIVGTYFDANFATQIFLRAKDGTFTTVDIPSPCANQNFGGQVVANSEGAIAGNFADCNGNASGFLRAPSGKFTLFKYPAAFVSSNGFFSFAPNITGITPGGTILGSYFDANTAPHGFLRTIDGTFTTFDAPNAAFSFFVGTSPTSINNSGTVAGFYFDTTQNSELRVFLRASNGVFSNFATPQVGTSTGAASINSSGAVAGNVQNFNCPNFPCTTVPISFLRGPNGPVSSVNDPEAAQGTFVISINPAGVVIGNYIDENGVQHGFVRKP